MRRLAALLALTLAPPALADEPVELTFIANEGVIIRHGEHAVAIDTPASNSYDGTYALPSAGMLNAMTTGGYPVGNLDAILFTHIHGDHFDAPEAAAIVSGQPSPRPYILGGNQVVDAFIEAGGNDEHALRPQTVDASCEMVDQSECRYTLTMPVPHSNRIAIEIDARPLFHREGIEHWTYRVEMGGVSVLHLGDTQPQMANFSTWDGVDFDVILYPYWFLQMAEGVAFLDAHPEARAIAFHIPAAATDVQIREALNGAEYLHTEGETRVLSAATSTDTSE